MTLLVRLFQRFADEQAQHSFSGFDLFGDDGLKLGRIEAIRLRQCRYEVEGHVEDADLALICGATRAEVREDNGTRAADGKFVLDIPLGKASPTLVIKAKGRRHNVTLPMISKHKLKWTRAKVFPRFCWMSVALLPDAIKWAQWQDLEARERIKQGFGFSQSAVRTVLDPVIMEDQAPLPIPTDGPAITIILPVFNAFDLLDMVLTRLKNFTDLPWKVVMIEDASTDARVRPFLQEWADAVNAVSPGRVDLICHSSNKGFVASANAGFSRALKIGNDVVLLNSDCLLPEGWASRLLAPIAFNRKIATVTPMANDAELLSVPKMAASGPLAQDAVDQIDAVARQVNTRPSLVPLPTGVGFCMAINLDFLRLVPQFDTAFGAGYGEEVDWCQKIRDKGGYHCCQSGLFVEHRGAASFGSGGKALRVQANDRIIAKRYPAFARSVQAFVRDDPLLTERMALACAWVGAHASDMVPVILAHSLGGGVEKMVQAKIAEQMTKGEGAIILRIGGSKNRWQIEVHAPQGMTCGATNNYSIIEKLLTPISKRRVIYACGVGDPWADELPKHLMWLRRRTHDRLEFEIHDFFPISPSQTLMGSGDIYSGPPILDTADDAHHFRSKSKKQALTLMEWQLHWGAAMATADEIRVFSPSSRQLMAQTYPKTAAKLVLTPHQLDDLPEVLARPEGDALPVIGVLGHIRRHKGAALLRRLSGHLERSKLAKLVVVGTVEPAYRLAKGSVVTGPYKIRDIDHFAKEHGITCWVIPSIWPETFSFVTHEALATGLPVFGFDLGAQGDALRPAQNGHVAPFIPGEEHEQLVALLENHGIIKPGKGSGRSRIAKESAGFKK